MNRLDDRILKQEDQESKEGEGERIVDFARWLCQFGQTWSNLVNPKRIDETLQVGLSMPE